MKYVILHDIRSRHNVGSIFRTADGAGVSKLFLCGYTPAPIDRFGREVPEIMKTSLGASESVSWEASDDTSSVIRRLQTEGVVVIAVEQTAESLPLSEFVPPPDVAYVFGNEIDGVLEEIRTRCDGVVEVPMRGAKESLNVSVAAGIVLYHGVDG